MCLFVGTRPDRSTPAPCFTRLPTTYSPVPLLTVPADKAILGYRGDGLYPLDQGDYQGGVPACRVSALRIATSLSLEVVCIVVCVHGRQWVSSTHYRVNGMADLD